MEGGAKNNARLPSEFWRTRCLQVLIREVLQKLVFQAGGRARPGKGDPATKHLKTWNQRCSRLSWWEVAPGFAARSASDVATCQGRSNQLEQAQVLQFVQQHIRRG